MRIELTTSSLPRKRSTPELHWRSWSGRRGSNPRPSAWKADALPTELLPHFSFLLAHCCVMLRIVGRSLPQGNSLSPHSHSLHWTKINFKTLWAVNSAFQSKSPIGLLSGLLWEKMDSNHRRYKPADLQSAPFGHSGILPFLVSFWWFLRWASYRRSVITTR